VRHVRGQTPLIFFLIPTGAISGRDRGVKTMRKKKVQHQRRHRKKPSKWRFVWTAVVTIARLLSLDWDFGE
jgi:hypothetical protein